MANAVAKVALGKCCNSGQTCVAPDYVLVHRSLLDQFLRDVEASIKTMYGEKPEGSDQMGKVINEIHT